MKILKKQLFEYDADGAPVYLAEIAGLSSETKPTAGLVSGSKFVEVNTGKTFVLDAESNSADWTELVVATSAVS